MKLLRDEIEQLIGQALVKAGISGDNWRQMLAPSRDTSQGDLSLPCFPLAKQLSRNPVELAQAIADGKIIGWFQGKSESGNRALGNRCILADPRNPDIKNIINDTIKGREDFRPFAPSCMEEHYQEYFDTNQVSPFMSRIVQVKSDKIPGVTHIDNTPTALYKKALA